MTSFVAWPTANSARANIPGATSFSPAGKSSHTCVVWLRRSAAGMTCIAVAFTVWPSDANSNMAVPAARTSRNRAWGMLATTRKRAGSCKVKSGMPGCAMSPCCT